jgi:hypothetical protein
MHVKNVIGCGINGPLIPVSTFARPVLGQSITALLVPRLTHSIPVRLRFRARACVGVGSLV